MHLYLHTTGHASCVAKLTKAMKASYVQSIETCKHCRVLRLPRSAVSDLDARFPGTAAALHCAVHQHALRSAAAARAAATQLAARLRSSTKQSLALLSNVNSSNGGAPLAASATMNSVFGGLGAPQGTLHSALSGYSSFGAGGLQPQLSAFASGNGGALDTVVEQRSLPHDTDVPPRASVSSAQDQHGATKDAGSSATRASGIKHNEGAGSPADSNGAARGGDGGAQTVAEGREAGEALSPCGSDCRFLQA